VERGDVLHLALEDGERRCQDRLKKILGDTPVPDTLELAFDWRRFDSGGLRDIEAWLNKHREARLIVIDTLKRVRPQERNRARLYDAD
jgi:hypothetical protein